MFTAEDIRSLNDRDLFETLSNDRIIIRVKEQLSRTEKDSPFRTRRRLLATSVRLSARMAPDLRKIADECVEKLGVDIPLELFVFASPMHNAMCFRPEAGRLLVMFASSLLEDLEGAELRFVTGHELGHHVYRHHDIPVGMVLRGGERPDPRLALALFAWSRYAEISADRAGAFCAEDEDAVALSLFKLASGLSGKSIKFNHADFLAQVDQMQVEDSEPGLGAPKEDWFSTHPFSPLRVKALRLFHESSLMNPDGTSIEELELGVQALMGMMEPNYLEAKTEEAEAMRRLLFAGALVVAAADGEISEGEIEIFNGFFGPRSFSEALDVEALEKDLDARIERVKTVAGITRAMHVMNDLCVVARAEEHTKPQELAVLERIADGLGISRGFVTRSLEADLDPD